MDGSGRTSSPQPRTRAARLMAGLATPPLRPAPQTIVPDVVLAMAVAAITLVPLTRGASLLLAPAAWIAAGVQIRRRRRRGERIGERLDSALGSGRLVTILVGFPLACVLLAVFVFWVLHTASIL